KKPQEYLLLVEGSVPTGENGFYCTLGSRNGEEVTMKDLTADLAGSSTAVIAVGSCASYGGIPAGQPNPTEARSVSEFLRQQGINKPVINVPGCPPHPEWMTGTIASILLNGLPSPDELDDKLRPQAFYGKLIHDNCPRRGFFDAGQFARSTSEEGCLYEIGCKGPLTYADCPLRLWNNGVSWCVGAGAQCIGCVEPDFVDRMAPMFTKLDEEALERFKIITR
ncbi:MAG: hydrogenase small subunit, partial [Spirochaetota bacterium]